MDYEWDPRKAAKNAAKHGVTFDQAINVFNGPLAITFSDPDHSLDEAREITIGMPEPGVILVVSHVRRLERLRIISARGATAKERKLYE